MRLAAFDEMIFQAAPLGETPLAHQPGLSVHIPVMASQKSFTHPLPFLVRRPPLASNDPNWAAFCGLLKDFGIPLQIGVAALEPLAVANIPLRFSRRNIDEGFTSGELETAEAIEIHCATPVASSRSAQFPIEITAWHELKTLVATVRELASAPIGLGLVIGDVATDLSNALAAKVDFVILELPTTPTELTPSDLDVLAWSVATARRMCVQADLPAFPIYVDAPVTHSDTMLKLFALGASALTIDSLVASCLPASSTSAYTVPRGMLSGIGAAASTTPTAVASLEKKLNQTIGEFKLRLRQQQLAHLSDLNADHLRALSPRVAQLCCLRSLTTAP